MKTICNTRTPNPRKSVVTFRADRDVRAMLERARKHKVVLSRVLNDAVRQRLTEMGYFQKRDCAFYPGEL